MSRTSQTSFTGLVMILIGLLGTSSHGRAQDFASLKLTVAPEKGQFVLGEPVTLKVQVMNLTSSAIGAHRSLDPETEMIQVYIAPPGETFRRYLAPRWGVVERRPRAAQISPGESLSSEMTLFFNQVIPGAQDFLQSSLPFGVAGAYRIRVEFHDIGFQQKITASIIQVAVTRPAGAEFAIWAAIQADPELAYFLQTGDSRKGPPSQQKAEQLVNQHAEAVQAKHLALALGKYYLRRDDAQAAIKHLQKASEAPGKSFLRAQALLELTKSYAISKNLDEAQKLCDLVTKEYAQTAMQQKFSRTCAEINAMKNATK